MLRRDDREQGLAERICLALKRAKTVPEYVQVLRCKCYKAALGQLCGIIMVRSVIACDYILRPALQAVLTDDNGAPLPGTSLWPRRF